MAMMSKEVLPEITKVRAGFYRVGAYCIHKGHRWCVYHDEKLLSDARFQTLEEAAWWAQHNQPPNTEREWPTKSSFA